MDTSAANGGAGLHEAGRPGCLLPILPDRRYIPVAAADEIVRHLGEGNSAVVVGESGTGKTAICKAAIRQFSDGHGGFHLHRAPGETELPAVFEWVASWRPKPSSLLTRPGPNGASLTTKP